MRAALAVATAVLVASSSVAVAQDTPTDMHEAVTRLVETSLGPAVAEVAGSSPLRLAVFGFGNKNGAINPSMGLLPVTIQGEIETALRAYLSKNASGKFFVISSDPGLVQVFQTASLDPSGINSSDIPAARTLLQQVNIPIAIVGKYSFLEPKDAPSSTNDPTASITLIRPTDTKDFTISISKQDIVNLAGSGDPNTKPTKKFNVAIEYKQNNSLADTDANAWKHIALQTSTSPDSAAHNVFFMVLKPEMKGKRYRVVIENKGPTPEDLISLDDTDDGVDIPNPGVTLAAKNAFIKDRLWAAAILIDGVNSFYQATGEKTAAGQEVIGPVVRHPSVVSKWILTAPDKSLVPATHTEALTGGIQYAEADDATDNIGAARELSKTERFKNAKFTTGQGSKQAIPGFQKNTEYADAFVFSDANASLAETVGITNDVGMIAVHFYGEELPPALKGYSVESAGTTTGAEVPHKVFPIVVRLEKNPEQVWRIFYRYEGDPTIPTDLVPFTN